MTVSSQPPLEGPNSSQQPGSKNATPWMWVGAACLVLILLAAGLSAYFNYQTNKKLERLIGPEPETAGQNDRLGQEFKLHPELAAIKLMVEGNPNLELVKSDVNSKTAVVRDKNSGKEMTLSFEEILNGEFLTNNLQGASIETSLAADEGTAQAASEDGQPTTATGGTGTVTLPDWLPAYPGSIATSSSSATGSNGRAVTMLETTDSADQALAFYQGKLKEAGFKVEKNVYEVSGQTAGGTITAERDGAKGEVSVLVGAQGGKTSIIITIG